MQFFKPLLYRSKETSYKKPKKKPFKTKLRPQRKARKSISRVKQTLVFFAA